MDVSVRKNPNNGLMEIILTPDINACSNVTYGWHDSESLLAVEAERLIKKLQAAVQSARSGSRPPPKKLGDY